MEKPTGQQTGRTNFLTEIIMFTKVVKVKKGNNKKQGCCDAIGGCRCND